VFTVTSWNVENFFAPAPSAQADFDAKLDALARVITAVAPDLLAVQEVGDEIAFEAVRERLGNGWTGALSRHFQASHAIRVGWLSSGPLTDVEFFHSAKAARTASACFFGTAKWPVVKKE